jgi:hypothetical protein
MAGGREDLKAEKLRPYQASIAQSTAERPCDTKQAAVEFAQTQIFDPYLDPRMPDALERH